MGRLRGLVAIAIVAILAGACGAPATSPTTSPTASGVTPSGTATGPPPSGLTSPATSPTAPGPTVGGSPSPGGALDPTAIATRLYAAADVAAATPLLRQVYAYLGVGLYTADGEQIQAGAETGPDDFYLYDFESDALAQAYIDGQTATVERLAALLGEAGVGTTATGQPLTGAELLDILADAADRARGDASLLTLRLVDALGLARGDPLDLTDPGLDAATAELDPLQAFMIVYDVLAGLETGPGEADAALAAAGPCHFVGSGGSRRGGSTLASRSGTGSIGGGAGWMSADDLALAASFKITITPQGANIHWWHNVTGEDRVQKFDALLEFKPPKNVSCGRNFRKEGPVEGATVTWKWDSVLDKNGQFHVIWTTGALGHSQVTFWPKKEARPKSGPLKADGPGRVIASYILKQADAELTVLRHQNLTVQVKIDARWVQTDSRWNLSQFEIPLQGEDPSQGERKGDYLWQDVRSCPPTPERITLDTRITATPLKSDQGDRLKFEVTLTPSKTTNWHQVTCGGENLGELLATGELGWPLEPKVTFDLPAEEGAHREVKGIAQVAWSDGTPMTLEFYLDFKLLEK